MTLEEIINEINKPVLTAVNEFRIIESLQYFSLQELDELHQELIRIKASDEYIRFYLPLSKRIISDIYAVVDSRVNENLLIPVDTDLERKKSKILDLLSGLNISGIENIKIANELIDIIQSL